jgi:hypothetical protein
MNESNPEKNELQPVKPEHYSRESILGRIGTLDEDNLKRFDAALVSAGFVNREQLLAWIADSEILEEDEVKPCIQALARVISEFEFSFVKGKTQMELKQIQREINIECERIKATYFD